MPQVAIDFMWQQYQVRFVDLTSFPETKGLDMGGYQLKAYAILLSSFKEVHGPNQKTRKIKKRKGKKRKGKGKGKGKKKK